NTMVDNERFGLNLNLTGNSDMAIIVQAMAEPVSGLDIRDRILPKSFPGSDLVNCLFENVDGFVGRDDARAFAARMLKMGYIRHPFHKSSFHEKSYYLFRNIYPQNISRLKRHEKSKDYESISDRSSIIDGDSGNSLLTTQHSVTTSAVIDKNNAPLESPSQSSSSGSQQLLQKIYLPIETGISAGECANHLVDMDLSPEQKKKLCQSIAHFCGQQRSYERFFLLLGQKLCESENEYTQYFEEVFHDQYDIVHSLENAQLQNRAKFFAHLLFHNCISWGVSLILYFLLSISLSQYDIFQCCGHLLNALIITINLKLQTNTNYISILCSSCLTTSNLLQIHIEPIVQAEVIQVLQQLHLFDTCHVNLSTLVSKLIKTLKSQDLSLRRAYVSCLRQLSQRKTKEIKLLFPMLNTETDEKLCSHIQDTLVYMLQVLGTSNLTHWLQLCKDVLIATIGPSSETDQQQTSTMATTTILLSSSLSSSSSSYFKLCSRPTGDDDKDSFDLHDDDDVDYTDRGGDEQLQTSTNQNSIHRSTSSAKWSTLVFAADCVKKLINFFEQTLSSNLHFDYIAAKERLRTYPNEDYLVIHLNTLITFSFKSCTSTNNQLHLFEDIDLSDHVIYEQYQAQVGVTLRLAFSQDTLSYTFLILPNEFGSSDGTDENSHGRNFYSRELNLDLTRTIYKANWSSIIQATTQ
ncbi:unnamed protein product, partial [Rotaria sp. Silwood1]